MLKKIGYILLWLLLLGYLIIVFNFVSRKESNVLCRNIKVTVEDSQKNGFVKRSDIHRLIKRSNIKVIGVSRDSINKEKLEEIIQKNPSVKNAEVYSTLTGDLRVEVDQRTPILRVFNGNRGYYIDEEGEIMPLSTNYTSRILVASGNISRKLALNELVELVRFIRRDDFWHSQIDQIYINSQKECILIPRVGDQKILFGSIENFQRKFAKLQALYRDGFGKVGWNRYKTINLKYKNQVVCTKRN